MTSASDSKRPLRIPPWLRVELPRDKGFACTGALLGDLKLNTVCRSARCPNIFECYSRKVATFLILGSRCTRGCAFCNIGPGRPEPVDLGEPERISKAVGRLGLSHAVVTSVTRDDLPDGGAAHFAAVLQRMHADHPQVTTEVLIPDFQGDERALATVLAQEPDVLNHNVETVPDLYPRIRPQAVYGRSLELLRRAKALDARVSTKSGLMVGLGESDSQVRETIQGLRRAECDIVTVGQYMRPTRAHPEVERYVHPDIFEEYAAFGRSQGIAHMFCAPLVRSSYNAALFARSRAG